MEQPTHAEALTQAGAIEHWEQCDNGLRGSELQAAAKCLRTLHAELESLRPSQQAERAVPSDAMVHAALKVQFPASYSEHLQHPANGPKTSARTGKEIDMARRMIAAALAAAPVQQAAPAGDASQPMKLLAKKHEGMRVDYSGLLWQCQRALRSRDEGGNAEMLRQLQGHLKELGQRWYAGDIAAVDEILQLYCIEEDARAAIASQQP